MIITEPGIEWVRFNSGYAPTGSSFVEYRCERYPRLRYIVQHPVGGARAVHHFEVEGIKNIFHTPGEAVAAMEANPS